MTSAELQAFVSQDDGAQAIIGQVRDPLWLATHLHPGFLDEVQQQLNHYLAGKGVVDSRGRTSDGYFSNLNSGGQVQPDPTITPTWAKWARAATIGTMGGLALPTVLGGAEGASAAGGGEALPATSTVGATGGLVPASATASSIGTGAGAGTGAAVGGTAAGGAAAGGAGLAGGGTEAAALPSTTIGSGAVPGIAPTTGIGAGAGTTAATTGGGIGGFLKSLVPSLIPSATNLIGAGIEAHAAGEAADKQLKGIEEGIALQKQLYEQQRADLGPYRTAGYGALSNLKTLLGVPTVADTPDSMKTSPTPGQVPNQGQPLAAGLPPGFQQASGASDWLMNQLNKLHVNGPAPGATTPNGAAPGQPVLMRAPDGTQQQVSPDQVAHYTQLGATRVS